ncbi:centromere protein T isoform X1 [Moschus berezovskii]|uniref:centromere protein T isoform X1 n=1 Tax=Moschus berezovskii TaxID=68408 RepID=UPI002443FBD7|nr:centromere protein T isoform X1 [Moschus berezovskii]
MADNFSPDSEPTTRTLLRRVLDTADPRTPRRARSTRSGCWSLHSGQRDLLETPSSRRLRSQTKMTVRRRSHTATSVDRLARVQASGHLEEQTPRTLLKNIILTAPESSIVMPEAVVKLVPLPQVVQPSRRESSRGSLELQLPELEPPTTLAPGLLAPGRRKHRLRLSEFQQGMDWGHLSQGEVLDNTCGHALCPLERLRRPERPGNLWFLFTSSVGPRENADASSLTSSLNLTFAMPLQPQSVKRPGLARRPPTRRVIDVGTFLQDLRDTSLAVAHPGESHRTPVTTMPTDMVLEDTQPFSQPLAGHSPSVHHSLPCPSHSGAKEVEGAASLRTQSSGPGLENNYSGPGKPAQLQARKVEEVDALAMGFPNTSSISGEDGIEPLQNGVGEEAEESMGESMNVREVEKAAKLGSARAEEPEGHIEVTEAAGSLGATEAEEPEGSSEDEDTSGRSASPELAPSTPEFLRTRRLEFAEPAPPPSTAVLPSELPKHLSARIPPRPRIPGSRPRQDPYNAGLNHYAKLFSFYAKMPMEKKAVEMVEKCLDKYFQHLCDDLEVFAAHAGRKTVRPEDLELLLRRQGLVTDQVSLHVLVERHLPLEYRQLLIPCAFSGNSVFPAE